MLLRTKILTLFAVTGLMAFATTFNIVGPTTPSGIPCNVSDPGCVNGTNFTVYGAQLTSPSAPNTNWTLTIEMNYPNNPTPMTAGNVIPPELWQDGLLYSIADFLITSNGKDYGIVLATHIKGGVAVDSYQAGNLYQAPNTQFDLVLSGQQPPAPPGVLPLGSAHPGEPVWLAPGGTLLGTGTISVALGGNGTPAQYTITDVFSAPADFLSTGNFTAIADSFVCANGLAVGTGTFTGGAGGGETPEPGTFGLLSIPLVFFAGRSLIRKLQMQKS
jgi:hypothetical protein